VGVEEAQALGGRRLRQAGMASHAASKPTSCSDVRLSSSLRARRSSRVRQPRLYQRSAVLSPTPHTSMKRFSTWRAESRQQGRSCSVSALGKIDQCQHCFAQHTLLLFLATAQHGCMHASTQPPTWSSPSAAASVTLLEVPVCSISCTLRMVFLPRCGTRSTSCNASQKVGKAQHIAHAHVSLPTQQGW
jgi:hypothetical protein